MSKKTVKSKKTTKKKVARTVVRSDKSLYNRLNRTQLLHAWKNKHDNLYVGPIFPHPNHSCGEFLKVVPVSWWRDNIEECLLRLGSLQEILIPTGHTPVFKMFRQCVTNDYCKDPHYGRFESRPGALYFWRRDVETEMVVGLDPPLHAEPKLPTVDYCITPAGEA